MPDAPTQPIRPFTITISWSDCHSLVKTFNIVEPDKTKSAGSLPKATCIRVWRISISLSSLEPPMELVLVDRRLSNIINLINEIIFLCLIKELLFADCKF